MPAPRRAPSRAAGREPGREREHDLVAPPARSRRRRRPRARARPAPGPRPGRAGPRTAAARSRDGGRRPRRGRRAGPRRGSRRGRAIRSTSSRWWELISTAAPDCRARRVIRSRISAWAAGSRPEDGSSRKSTSGSCRVARTRPSRRFIPVEKVPTRSSARSRRPAWPSRSSIVSAADAVEGAVEGEVLARREPVGHPRLLEQHPDAPAKVGPVGERGAEDERLARAGAEEPEEEAHGRGLARAVRAEQAEDLAGLDRERDLLEHRPRHRTPWRGPAPRSAASPSLSPPGRKNPAPRGDSAHPRARSTTRTRHSHGLHPPQPDPRRPLLLLRVPPVPPPRGHAPRDPAGSAASRAGRCGRAWRPGS